ncbi:MAG: ABC transporter substrate-binding protein, partial [Spirochaetaceae bacterium]
MKLRYLLPLLLIPFVSSCGADEGVTLEEAEERRSTSRNELLERTVTKPGPGEWEQGTVGGRWVSSINNDPRTFNTLTARDADTRTIIDTLYAFLADYDPYEREFTPNLASFEIESDEAENTLRVIFTLRDDLYWTTPGSSEEDWVKVTSDDVVYWYNEIDGDREFQLPAYPGQFVDMPDGEQERVTIEKIDELSFAFTFPRIVANPVLSTNMTFGPRHI